MSHIAITIQHPAHVHFYRHAIADLREAGHEVHVFVREKGVALRLLEAYDIPHTVLAGRTDSTLGVAAVQVVYELRLLRALRRLDPDVVTAVGGVAAAHVAPLVGARSVVFVDRGVASTRLVTPFAHTVCTPTWYDEAFGRGHRRYEGCHELAYLHPDRFTPDAGALADLGVDPHEPYAVLRFTDRRGHRDAGQHRLSPEAKGDLLTFLEEHGDVYITTEGPLPDAFEPYRLPVPVHRLHDLLAYADVYVGGSQTMAAEAAILATPSVRVGAPAGWPAGATVQELASRGLIDAVAHEQRALARVRQLVDDPDVSATWRERREHFLSEAVDVTDYVVSVLEEEGRSTAPNALEAVAP